MQTALPPDGFRRWRFVVLNFTFVEQAFIDDSPKSWQTLMQDLIAPRAANREGSVRSFVEFESARTARWSHDNYDTTRTRGSQVPLEEAMTAHPYVVRGGFCTASLDPPPVFSTRCPVSRTTATRWSSHPSVSPARLVSLSSLSPMCYRTVQRKHRKCRGGERQTESVILRPYDVKSLSAGQGDLWDAPRQMVPRIHSGLEFSGWFITAFGADRS
jgi:hypothetical protein